MEEMKDATGPETKDEVFLKVKGYYGGFIPNYGTKAPPLKELQKKISRHGNVGKTP